MLHLHAIQAEGTEGSQQWGDVTSTRHSGRSQSTMRRCYIYTPFRQKAQKAVNNEEMLHLHAIQAEGSQQWGDVTSTRHSGRRQSTMRRCYIYTPFRQKAVNNEEMLHLHAIQAEGSQQWGIVISTRHSGRRQSTMRRCYIYTPFRQKAQKAVNNEEKLDLHAIQPKIWGKCEQLFLSLVDLRPSKMQCIPETDLLSFTCCHTEIQVADQYCCFAQPPSSAVILTHQGSCRLVYNHKSTDFPCMLV